MEFKIEKIFNSSTKVPITVGVGSFVAGVVVGASVSYILERRKNKNKPVDAHEVPRRIFEASDLFDTPVGTIDKLEVTEDGVEGSGTLNDEGAALLEEVELHDGDRIIPHPDEPEEEVALVPQSIFAKTDDEWDLEEEMKGRNSQEPYVLHQEEFYADEMGYHQTSLVYYHGDGQLVDTDNKPIYAIDRVIGTLKFGHGSRDSNVFFVRNDRLKAEYEIIQDPGYYAVEVLGLSVEESAQQRDLKHAHGIPRLSRDARD